MPIASNVRALAALALALFCLSAVAPLACGVGVGRAEAQVRAGSSASAKDSGGGQSSLESVADKAGRTGRAVALKIIGLALALAAVVLVFKRDFREAAALLAVGLVAVLLASPDGLNLLQDTAHYLFGG